MLGKCMEKVRKTVPLVHCITNYVTVNDVANALLAGGASPIMSDEPKDVADITSVCNALCINIGTLNARSIEAMFIAGEEANRRGNAVVLDPVGAGASTLRTSAAMEIMRRIKVDIIKGNASEIKTLALGSGTTKGVDADIADEITEEKLDAAVRFVKDFSKSTGAVIAMTGKIDLVADEEKCYVIRNGHSAMSKITGTGCMLGAIAAAYAAANADNMTEATAAAVCMMGLAGETAVSRMSEYDGNATLRNYIIDAVYNIDGKTLDGGAVYEIR